MVSNNRFRKFVKWVAVWVSILNLVSMVFAPTSLAATPSQAGISWDYKLLGKLNSAQDPDTGSTIIITGSGSFNLLQKSIIGDGNYTILDAGGNVVGSGTWEYPEFDSFTPLVPGKSPGEGGHLEFEALFTGTGTNVLNGPQHIVIQCSMWGSDTGNSGYPWPPDFVEVGSYTTHKTGGIMFNLDQ